MKAHGCYSRGSGDRHLFVLVTTIAGRRSEVSVAIIPLRVSNLSNPRLSLTGRRFTSRRQTGAGHRSRDFSNRVLSLTGVHDFYIRVQYQ